MNEKGKMRQRKHGLENNRIYYGRVDGIKYGQQGRDGGGITSNLKDSSACEC
jgi:hypothetical protein